MSDTIAEKKNYHLSDGLGALLKDVYGSEQNQEIQRRLDEYINEFQRLMSIDQDKTANTIHYIMDRKIAEKVRLQPGLSSKISCAKGCDHCCHQSVMTTRAEARLILKHILFKNVVVDWQRMLKQVGVEKKEWRVMEKQFRACVLLDEKGECGAYDYRPSSCRKLLSLDNPEKCKLEGEPPQMFVMPEAEIIASAAASVDEVGSLPLMLLLVMDEVHAELCSVNQ